MSEYLREHKFTACYVTVRTDKGRVSLSAGATLTPEQALELVESILAARATVVAAEGENGHTRSDT